MGKNLVDKSIAGKMQQAKFKFGAKQERKEKHHRGKF